MNLNVFLGSGHSQNAPEYRKSHLPNQHFRGNDPRNKKKKKPLLHIVDFFFFSLITFSPKSVFNFFLKGPHFKIDPRVTSHVGVSNLTYDRRINPPVGTHHWLGW